MMTTIVARADFQTVRQFISRVQDMLVGIRPDDVYLKNAEGYDLECLRLEQEVMSDGSVCFNVIVSTRADPNS